MQKLSEATLAAIGRMTVAATDLEYALASLADSPAALFAEPGAALRAARDASPPRADDIRHWIDGSATQLVQSQAALRAIWRGGRTDPALFDEITSRLLRCREALVAAQGLRATAP
ncbi:hypothetical protein [Actinoplanes subtropicus]|uniref:hypothetical protein n=1 Tax=Actinoplanes subtropicus TaxID=543632 RepID=UPI0004C3ED54|nr:hypothetical protein [Actinoplanes subtropicus]